MDEDDDGRFPDDSPVLVRYPRSKQEERGDRSAWPWLPGSILSQCGPDEWRVRVEARELAMLDDGRPAPARTADGDLFYPVLFPGRQRDPARCRRGGPVIPAAVADSWLFWLVIIDGLIAVYILPTVIGIARQIDGLGLVICLNVIPAGWPAALLLACIMPRKQIR
jgi:hypothetical protein